MTARTLQVEPIDPRDAAVRGLIALSDAYMTSLYPAESNHLESAEALSAAHVHFLGGRIGGELVACGAVRIMRDDGLYGEIKRLYVLEHYRGCGHAGRIMDALEQHLRGASVPVARLETGIHQPEALALYRGRGYLERSPFGAYRLDPLSLFMEKRIIR